MFWTHYAWGHVGPGSRLPRAGTAKDVVARKRIHCSVTVPCKYYQYDGLMHEGMIRRWQGNRLESLLVLADAVSNHYRHPQIRQSPQHKRWHILGVQAAGSNCRDVTISRLLRAALHHAWFRRPALLHSLGALWPLLLFAATFVACPTSNSVFVSSQNVSSVSS